MFDTLLFSTAKVFDNVQFWSNEFNVKKGYICMRQFMEIGNKHILSYREISTRTKMIYTMRVAVDFPV